MIPQTPTCERCELETDQASDQLCEDCEWEEFDSEWDIKNQVMDELLLRSL